jgi:hypothetical protein
MGVKAETAKSTAQQAEHAAERGAEKAAVNPALERVARAGWITKGLLYLTMGALAMGLALGVSGATDQRGILRLLTKGGPWGNLLLIAIAVTLGAHALWNFFSAIFDPLGSRDDPKSWGRRLAFAGRGVAYAMLLFFCMQLVSGSPGSDSDSLVPKAAATALDHPFGPVLTVLGGLIAMAVGVALLVQAARRSPADKDLQGEQMTEKERKTASTLGRFGTAAYGLVAIVIGWFVVQAALFRDPKQAKGIVAAFGALAQQPAGRLLLGLIAVCFVALGLYSLAAARWMRMPGARR